MGDLILEGMLRASTLPVLQSDLPLDLNLAPSPDPAFELYALGLRPKEAHLLTLADGTKSVRDLLAQQRERSGVVVVSHAAEEFLGSADTVVMQERARAEAEARDAAEAMCRQLLANPVTEDYAIRVAVQEGAGR